MTLAASDPATKGHRVPFIRSQRFLLLQEVANADWYLQPERFRAARLLALGGNAETSNEATEEQLPFRTSCPDEDETNRWWEAWQPIDRGNLLFDPAIRRLCLTIDGGVGKTTTLRWCRAMIARKLPGQFAIMLNLRDCEELAAVYDLQLQPVKDRSRCAQQLMMQCLVRHFRVMERHHPVFPNGTVTDATLAAFLRRSIRRGALTLLIDGLDQTGAQLGSQSKNPIVEGLCELLHGLGKNVRVVLAGRPHAVTRYWKTLFHNQSWRFAQIDGFRDRQQRKAFLGERYQAVENLGAEELSIPRMLEAARHLPVKKLEAINSASELYCELIDHLWKQDQQVDRLNASQRSQAFKLLACIAFEMFVQNQPEGIPQSQFGSFIERLRVERGSQLGLADVGAMTEALVRLGETNSLVDFCFLDSDGEIRDLYFRDTTLQEFFAALWLVNYAMPTDCGWIGRYPFLRPHKQLQHETLHRVWKFAVEMPTAHSDPLAWLRLVGELFRPAPELGRRSNEMMFRSWARLNQLAGQPARGFQGLSEETKRARQILEDFHGEFSGPILDGQRGMDAQRIAQEFLSCFQPIPPHCQGKDDLAFASGLSQEQLRHSRVDLWGRDETRRQVQLPQQFELAAVPVTNELYRLYESAHSGEGAAAYPVVEVDWFAAKMFCLWINPYRDPDSNQTEYRYDLPHELEWEFAARAGTTSIQYFCDDDQLEREFQEIMEEHTWAGRNTRPKEVAQLQPNAYGLYDMVGAIWQWCDNAYEDDPRSTLPRSRRWPATSRVCRGGSWYDHPMFSRSSSRDDLHPASLSAIIGFRVARAPEKL